MEMQAAATLLDNRQLLSLQMKVMQDIRTTQKRGTPTKTFPLFLRI
jgi:hypothetical protein